MKIEELNKENALSVKNNAGAKNDYFDPQNWVDSYMEFVFKEIIKNKIFKIYVCGKYHGEFIVTDLRDTILQWFSIYDFLNKYETKYEYMFVGHERNYHVDKQTGEMNSYEW